MNKTLVAGLLILAAACTQKPKPASINKPYKFDLARLNQLVKDKKAIHMVDKTKNGARIEKFYLGDTAKYEILLDSAGLVEVVIKKNEHGQMIWREEYYSSGQRKSHYSFAHDEKPGPRSNWYEGPYETYYENGNIQETGEFKDSRQVWKLEYDKGGKSGDTLYYEYK